MKPARFLHCFLLLTASAASCCWTAVASADGFGPPQLKWTLGGCYSSWCETGWYSSPALVDVNRDGIKDVISAAYTLTALNGKTGKLLWRSQQPSRRTWPGVVVADIDRDGQKEIAIAQAEGYLSVFTLAGKLKWQARPATAELRGLLAADLDGNGSSLELVVTGALGSPTNTWVYDRRGKLRAGWPQLKGERGYAWGVYNANAAAGNLDPKDAKLELAVPSDVHYINVYKPNGSPLRAHSGVYPGKDYWGQVGIWESPAIEQRGWGECDGTRNESFRANFADGPAVIADLNRDGRRELVVTGNMYNCGPDLTSQYTALFIFNKDRTRFHAGGFDWREIPVDTGAPLSQDYNLIETAQSNPVVVDLDGDGRKEIVYAAYDGRMHAVWLDQAVHGSWPYAVYQAAEGLFRFASEPAVADLDRDGHGEVIFTSWVQKGSNATGKLHIVSDLGEKIHEIDLPMALSGSWNGALAAPTLGNIDADRDLEIVVNTAASGVVAYDLPGTARARILWGTGRGSYTRNAAR